MLLIVTLHKHFVDQLGRKGSWSRFAPVALLWRTSQQPLLYRLESAGAVTSTQGTSTVYVFHPVLTVCRIPQDIEISPRRSVVYLGLHSSPSSVLLPLPRRSSAAILQALTRRIRRTDNAEKSSRGVPDLFTSSSSTSKSLQSESVSSADLYEEWTTPFLPACNGEALTCGWHKIDPQWTVLRVSLPLVFLLIFAQSSTLQPFVFVWFQAISRLLSFCP